MIGVAVLVVALVAAAVGGAAYLRNRDDGSDASSSAASGSTGSASGAKADSRTEAIRRFCDDPRPLTGPGTIAAFTPGAGAVAYAQLPQPASSTEPAASRVLQVSPEVGKPNLTLSGSVNLVSLAVCVQQQSSTKVTGTCSYELTNPSSIGQKATAPLLVTTFRARLIELRTAKTLSRGTITTAVDRCPTYAYIGGKGVSNPLTDDELVFWLAKQLPGGVPR